MKSLAWKNLYGQESHEGWYCWTEEQQEKSSCQWLAVSWSIEKIQSWKLTRGYFQPRNLIYEKFKEQFTLLHWEHSESQNLPLYLLVWRKGFKFFPVSSNNHLNLVFGESRDSLLLLVSTDRYLGSIWLAVAEALLGLCLCFFALDETETEMLDRPCSIWHGNWQNKNEWVILTSMMALFIFVNEFCFFVLMLYL